MHESFRLGRIAGIPIGVNWSVLIIAALLAAGLAGGALPDEAAGYPTGVYWFVGTLTALAFFGSLLAHEMAHALIARRNGMPVEGITLWLLGGVSRLGGDAPSAPVELRMAIAGPATSLGLGLVLLGLAAAGGPLNAPRLVTVAVGWLGFINVVLGVFNLAPAFPLDGGRVLRALLWHIHGDRLRATATAAAAGRGFGYLLVAGGVLAATAGYVFNGLWFVLLGWFVVMAARSEQAQVTQHALLSGVRVRDVMSHDPVTAPPHLTVSQFLEHYVLARRYSAYPLVDDEGLVTGLVTLDRLRTVAPAERDTTEVGTIAFGPADVPSAAPDDSVETLIPGLLTSRSGRALVFEGNHLVGIVSRTDIAHTLERRALMVEQGDKG